jgi:NAD(P)-dependent dehydrogenase (short-subunit alcohol dehydrogenase family)
MEEFCKTVTRDYITIDVLINNAATFESSYNLTVDGFEKQWQVNYLSCVFLTLRLLPLLRNSVNPIVINTSSVLHRIGHLSRKWPFRRNYIGLLTYGYTKLCLMLFTRSLFLRCPWLTCCSYDPGSINTDIGNRYAKGWSSIGWKVLKNFFRPPAAAAKTVLQIIANAGPSCSGKYFSRSKTGKPSAYSINDFDADNLWNLTNESLRKV